MLQTDAPITRGSSGGALVDDQGRLIGITTAIGVTDAGAEGVGFAIPVELVTRITDEIIEQGFVQHTFLGVLLQDHFEPRDGAQVPEGAVIIDFVDPSGARDAGLALGDRLTLINGRTVHTKEDIINELRKFRVGDSVTFEADRAGSTIAIDVILGERPVIEE
jgi:S1-C subfamily serine protease